MALQCCDNLATFLASLCVLPLWCEIYFSKKKLLTPDVAGYCANHCSGEFVIFIFKEAFPDDCILPVQLNVQCRLF